MKYETVSFFGHKNYARWLEDQDIEIFFVNMTPDNDSERIVITFRRVWK